jgi:hypothetical protein
MPDRKKFSDIRTGVESQVRYSARVEPTTVAYAATIADLTEEYSRRFGNAVYKDRKAEEKAIAIMDIVKSTVWSALKGIPYAGGYFSLLHQVVQNPIAGTWSVLRTEAGPWNPSAQLFGGRSNGVISPLGPGEADFNYASGRVSMFNRCWQNKADQFEADLNALTQRYTQSLFGGHGPASALSVDAKAIEVNKNKAYREWKVIAIKTMAMPYFNIGWITRTLHQLATANIDFGKHAAYIDLSRGEFDDPVAGGFKTKEQISLIQGSLRSTSSSNLVKVITSREPVHFDPIDEATRVRILQDKTLMVAYLIDEPVVDKAGPGGILQKH